MSDDLNWPTYVTVTLEDDGSAKVATNCETQAGVRQLLALAAYEMAEDVEWEDD